MSTKLGTRVEIIGKGVVGTVAYIGTTAFSPGKWIGVVLDDAHGKNNGTVQGKTYFTCPDNHGIFVRHSQIVALDEKRSPRRSPTNLCVTPTSSESTAVSTPASRKVGATSHAAKRMAKSTENMESGMSNLPRVVIQETATVDTLVGSACKASNLPKHQVMVSKEQESMITQKSDDIPVLLQTSIATSVSMTGDTVSSSMSLDERLSSVQHHQEKHALKAEIRDLKEKLETVLIRRADDKVKRKEMEKVKIQCQQLLEYKGRMQEVHADLQRQLQISKKVEEDLRQEFDQYKNEMADVSDAMEMVALDKEMAEEKTESLQQELENQKEKIEELTLELELLRAEISEKGSGGVAASFEMNQLEQQNTRIKDGLVKMRDLLSAEKHACQQSEKRCDKQTGEINALQKDNDRLSAHVSELDRQVIELKEQVDAALGAEEMVERLTERNLQLEERIEVIEEEKNDLDSLNEMNEELQENAKETELELREERQRIQVQLGRVQQRLDLTLETVSEYEVTLNKFRGLVSQLQESNAELRDKLIESGTKVETPSIDLWDFKAKFAETKAFTKVIDMELQKMEIEQLSLHVQMLLLFMPNAFLVRGSDHDAVQVLLLVQRVLSKAVFLTSQVKEKFPVAGKLNRDDVLSSSEAKQSSFTVHFLLQLALLQSTMHLFDSALKNCSVELFIKVGTLLPEMTAHEKTLNGLIEMLRKDKLDDTLSLELLMKSIAFFQQLYAVHLAGERVDCTGLMSHGASCVISACHCVAIDVDLMKMLLPVGQEQSEFFILLKDLELSAENARSCARKVRRRLPHVGAEITMPLLFSQEVQMQITDCYNILARVANTLHNVCERAMKKVSEMTDMGSLFSKLMEELCQEATEKFFFNNDSIYKCLRDSFESVVVILNKLSTAMENGEYDIDVTDDAKTVAPLNRRSEAMRNHYGDVDAMCSKLGIKDDEVKEAKRCLKLKQEELSEQQVRVDVTEKRLEVAAKESDIRVEKVQRKLDEANLQMKRREKEFEETCDSLQSDVDNLEQEKLQLKDRLHVLSKKTLLEGLTRQSTGSTATQPSSPSSILIGGGVNQGDCALLKRQIGSLQQALKSTRRENIRLKANSMKEQLTSLHPLTLPVKPSWLRNTGSVDTMNGVKTAAPCQQALTSLVGKTNRLLMECNKLSVFNRVVDITKNESDVVKRIPAQQILARGADLMSLERQVAELQVQVTTLLAASHTGGQVRTDFGAFPTPQFAKMLQEKIEGSVLIGQVCIPCPHGKGQTIPINIQPNHLHAIHSKLVN